MDDAGLSQIRKITIEATVTRADGTVEELGVIADSDWEKEETDGDGSDERGT
jgi:hypothetical protein